MANPGDLDEHGITPGGVERAMYDPRRLIGRRPLTTSAVFIAGIGVLAALTAVLIVTSRGEEPPPITCLPVTVDEGEALIRDGQVARVSVLTVRGQPQTGPIAVSMDLRNGSCRELPKGVAGQRQLYEAVGVVTVHNQSQSADNRVRIDWEEQDDIPPLLLATNTPTPTPVTPSPTPTMTPVPPTETPAPPTPTPAPPTPTPTSTPEPPTPTRTPPTSTATRVPPTATATPPRPARAATPEE
jgi:hypothetical protein